MEYESKSGMTNNMGEWNRSKITQTIPKQHKRKERNQGNTKKTNLVGHCAYSMESAIVKIQNIFNTRNNITCNTNCK